MAQASSEPGTFRSRVLRSAVAPHWLDMTSCIFIRDRVKKSVPPWCTIYHVLQRVQRDSSPHGGKSSALTDSKITIVWSLEISSIMAKNVSGCTSWVYLSTSRWWWCWSSPVRRLNASSNHDWQTWELGGKYTVNNGYSLVFWILKGNWCDGDHEMYIV